MKDILSLSHMKLEVPQRNESLSDYKVALDTGFSFSSILSMMKTKSQFSVVGIISLVCLQSS